MRRTPIAAAVVSLMVLAACDTSGEPSAPPTAQDALTTATSSPPEDEVVTSEPVLTEEPETEEPEADGPPEMPAAAMEQTQAGAEAFALHYVDLLNYTARQPQAGLLEPLGAEGCESCRNHEESVAYGQTEGDYLANEMFGVGQVDSIFLGDGARLSIAVNQRAQPYFRDGEEIDRELSSAEANLIFRVEWDEEWQVQEITVEQ